MKTPVQHNRDFLAGLLFMVIGGIGFYVAFAASTMPVVSFTSTLTQAAVDSATRAAATMMRMVEILS